MKTKRTIEVMPSTDGMGDWLVTLEPSGDLLYFSFDHEEAVKTAKAMEALLAAWPNIPAKSMVREAVRLRVEFAAQALAGAR